MRQKMKLATVRFDPTIYSTGASYVNDRIFLCYPAGWCVGLNWIRDAWLSIKYRFRCPYPIDGHRSVKSCIAAGLCGCDNSRLK